MGAGNQLLTRVCAFLCLSTILEVSLDTSIAEFAFDTCDVTYPNGRRTMVQRLQMREVSRQQFPQ